MTVKFNPPCIFEEDIADVVKVLRSGWLAHGEYSKKFEDALKDLTQSAYCILTSNCTAALHLVLLAHGIGTGDEVIVPAQTHVATAHAVELTGARAVIVDVDAVYGNIDPSAINAYITSQTKAIIPVHLAGVPCAMETIMEIAHKHHLLVIEDCAHALGSRYQGKHVGTFGVAGAFSFYPTKHVTTGEGGAVITNQEDVYRKVLQLRAFGIDTAIQDRKLPGLYDVAALGTNYRMTDFQAALGYHQLQRLKEWGFQKRRDIVQRYRKGFAENSNIRLLPEHLDADTAYMFFPVYVKAEQRDDILLKLKEEQIGATVHYITPISLMTYYQQKYAYRAEQFPGAVTIGQQQISLPLQISLTDEQILEIIEHINRWTR